MMVQLIAFTCWWEGLVEDTSYDGGFSETTAASFSVDAAIGAIDGDTTEAIHLLISTTLV